MSRRRPYLDIKESVLDLFRTTARWLHDSIQKESMFEKPYLDRDYRKMHLNIPAPDWPSTKIPGGTIPDRPKTWTFIWDPGICTLGVASPQCGQEFTLGVSIGLLPPGSEMKTIEWSAVSSNSACISITSIDHGLSGAIHCQVADECEDTTVTICVTGKLIGSIRESLVVESPFSGTGVLDYRVATNLPALSSSYSSGVEYPCGCVDFYLDCTCQPGSSDIAWDDESSAETIGRSDSASVAITEAGNGSPYTWSISGTGFWIDAGHSKTSKSSQDTSCIIYTDNTACGTGLITITACDGETASGQILCTFGEWTNFTIICGEAPNPARIFVNVDTQIGKTKYTDTYSCADSDCCPPPGDCPEWFPCTPITGYPGYTNCMPVQCCAPGNCYGAYAYVVSWDWECT